MYTTMVCIHPNRITELCIKKKIPLKANQIRNSRKTLYNKKIPINRNSNKSQNLQSTLPNCNPMPLFLF